MTVIDALAFLGFVFVISLSGVLMPGPMTAATIVKSYSDKWAGAKVSVGHAVVEFPLLAIVTVIVILGSESLANDNLLIIAIGIIGGVYLLVMGASMLRNKNYIPDEADANDLAKNSFVLGITTTLFNPGFILWWFAIGALIVTQALEFGLLMIPVFGVVHWSCDLVWGLAMSFGIQKAKQVWKSKIKEIIRIGCATLIVVFGALFLANAVLGLL